MPNAGDGKSRRKPSSPEAMSMIPGGVAEEKLDDEGSDDDLATPAMARWRRGNGNKRPNSSAGRNFRAEEKMGDDDINDDDL